MESDRLIRELVDDAAPVRRLGHPGWRLVRWLAAAALCLVAGLSVFGLRADLAETWREPLFVLQALLTLAVVVLAAAGALVLSVPGRERGLRDRWLPLAALTLWLATLAVDFVRHSALEGAGAWLPGRGAACVREIVFLGLVPGLILFFMTRRGASVRLGWSGWLVAIALAALGALGTQLTCMNDTPAHILVWHFLPVLAVGAAGIYFGRLLLRW